jgi:hypothetical protein
MRAGSLIIPILAAFAFTSSGAASPTYFETTGSYYDVVFGNLTWTAARAAAEATSYLGIQGRLGTITSQQENDFVRDNLLNFDAFGNSYWLGAQQVTTNGLPLGPAEGWQWISGEPWEYTNWKPGEPNDQLGLEHCLEIYTVSLNATWNDLADNDSGLSEGYIIEYAAVPEPSSFAVIGLGGAVLMSLRRRS